MCQPLNRKEVPQDHDSDDRRIDEHGIKYYFSWQIMCWLPLVEITNLPDDDPVDTESPEYLADLEARWEARTERMNR